MTFNSIQHVIVLILENRSFDHVFGARHGVEGLTGEETNPDARAYQGIPGSTVAVHIEARNPYVTFPDPPHEFADVCVQLFSTETAPVPAVASNKGFVIAYAEKRGPNGLLNGPQIGSQAMQYFSPAQLPVLNRLADEFVVCDHWFASVPGPTWPNRLFLHCATSGGLADSSPDVAAVTNALLGAYDLPSIYQSLDRGGKTWCVYYHDPPQSLSLRYVNERWRTNMRHFDAFAADLKQPEFPNYAVVEPNSGLLSAADGNDMHPPHDVRRGELLIASIYKCLRESKYWNTSLFVVVFDEHGGFYDHCPPPYGTAQTVAPDDRTSAQPAFNFDRLGVRVPCVLVSPWLPRGYVDQRQFDHSSLAGTIKKLFALENCLSRRDAAAHTFENLFTAEIRENALAADQLRALPAGQIATALDLQLSAHQRTLLAMATDPNAPRPMKAQADHAVAARREAYNQLATLASMRDDRD